MGERKESDKRASSKHKHHQSNATARPWCLPKAFGLYSGKKKYCVPKSWDLSKNHFIVTHKSTQATSVLPLNATVMKTQNFEDCSEGRLIESTIPGQVGMGIWIREKSRLAEEELLNCTWWSRGLSAKHEMRTDRLKEHKIFITKSFISYAIIHTIVAAE